ncbi:MAG: hypothetical protein ACJ71Q_12780 [Terriglobales bacterium]|jgi:hypothetical protein
MLLDQHHPERASQGEELNLLPPPELNISLLRSLFANLRDCILPDRLPPLQLSSRPVHVGMLVGDILDVPWYRTILSNIGDAISPEILPPLQLESQPVDVELISDLPAWWRSLLRNLADSLAPERQPALHLTSGPVNPEMASEVLITPRWSSLLATPLLARPLIGTPEVFRPDPRTASFDRPVTVAAPMRTTLLQLPSLTKEAPAAHGFDHFERKLVRHLQRSIRRSHIRQFVWLSVIVTQVTVLVVLRVMSR